VYRVTLHPEAQAEAFEKLMETEVLENTTVFRDGHAAQDELYAHTCGGEHRGAYIWIIRCLPSIDGAFTHNADAGTAFKSLKVKVEPFGSITPL
jgi:hypothetical protein